MIREAIAKITAGENLSAAEAAEVMAEIMDGSATPAQVGAFLVGLRMKGETADEITGMARVMRARCRRVDGLTGLVDTCGTGGDGFGTFNISTAAAFVAAGAGLKVAKHGNRAMSSRCGSADVLEALGVKIDLEPQDVAACIREEGIGFLFAPLYHPAMKHAAGPRREVGIRTVFNWLGPLTNPAGAEYQVLGVADAAAAPKLAQALQNLGTRRAFVVHGHDGVDEVSISAPTTVYDVSPDGIRTFVLSPEELGLKRASLMEVAGGTAALNAVLVREVLTGVPGPRRDVVVLNAAAALVVGGAAEDFQEGIELARRSIDSGAAQAKLEGLISRSRMLGLPKGY
ncbi:MAG: anthranilate phosphoribosyltransferase [Chloroflexota bacterium]